MTIHIYSWRLILRAIFSMCCLINLNSWKLEDIATYLNIPFDTNLHDALVDIDLTRKCFCRLASKYLNFEE